MVHSPIFSYMIVPSQRYYGEAWGGHFKGRKNHRVGANRLQANLNGPSKNHPKWVAMIHILVCLKMLCTPKQKMKPNGYFADHYPVFKWLFHWEYSQHFQTNPYFGLQLQAPSPSICEEGKPNMPALPSFSKIASSQR